MLRDHQHLPLQQEGCVDLDDAVDAEASKENLDLLPVHDRWVLVCGPEERGGPPADLVLHQEPSLVRERDLLYDVGDVPLDRYRELCRRDLHSVQLHEYLLESSVEAVVTQDANGLQSPHGRRVPDVHALKLLPQRLRRRLVKYQASAVDERALLVSETKVEEFRGALLRLEHEPRGEAEIADGLWKRVVWPVFFRIPVHHPGLELSLHDVSISQAKQPIKKSVGADTVR